MLPPDAPEAELVKEVEDAAERAAHLTRQMLAYAGRSQFIVESLDLSAAVRAAADLLRPSLSNSISVYLDLDPALPTIEADPREIEQVTMNIVLNAGEAIGDHGGMIAIKTFMVDLREKETRDTAEVGTIEPRRYVCLEVRDSGCGMDEGTRSRIFDPFFSTKFTGRGLGLAAVAGIVRSHNGAVAVESAVGAGTTFRVMFPVAVGRVSASQPALPAAASAASTGTVLVVDDEDIVLRQARVALERHGYRVLAAGSGPMAIDAFQRDPMAVDVVLLDLSMPGMDGRETLDFLARIRPGVRVIVSSGYGEPESMRRFAGRTVSGFLQKPYRPAVLIAKIEEALAGA
jgi:CheY-like chemotaxis protein